MRKVAKRYAPQLYAVFRIFVGLLFFQHGLQKLFGLLGGNMADVASMMWFAGLIEFTAGLFIVVGLFTRLSTLLAGLEMVVAYFMVHAPNALAPIQNKGELALLYFAAFLVLYAQGNGMWSLERQFLGKETF